MTKNLLMIYLLYALDFYGYVLSVTRLASERFSPHLRSPGRCAQAFWWVGLLPAHNWPVV